MVPPKTKKKEGNKTKAKKLAIREGVLDAPTESHQSSPSESSADEEGKEEEEEPSEAHSSHGEKRSVSEDVKEIIPPRTYKCLRKAYIAPTGHSAPMEPASSSSSEDVRRRREHPAAER